VRVEGESVEEIWESLKKGVKCETRKEIKIRKKRLGEHSWWDAECKRNKRKVYKSYKRWKKERQSKEKYLRLRREFRENCKEKEERNRKRIEEEIKNITTKAQRRWKFVNLGRKKARIVDENISMEEWKRHFLELLGERGTGEEIGEKRRTVGDQEEELREEEIEIQLRKIKSDRG